MTAYTEGLIALLPVIVGGAIGVVGSICGTIVLEAFKTRKETRTHRRDELEKLLSLAYEARYWIQTNSVAELFDLERDKRKIPTADMRTISLLYWPELRQEVVELNGYQLSDLGYRTGRQAKAGGEARC